MYRFETRINIYLFQIVFILLNTLPSYAQKSNETEKINLRPQEMNLPLNYSIDYRAKNAMKIYLNYQLSENELNLGPISIKATDFKVELNDNQLIIFWPQSIINKPEFLIKTMDGRLLFTSPAVNRLLVGDNLKKLDQQVVQFCFKDNQATNQFHQFCTGFYKFNRNDLKQNKKKKSPHVFVNNQNSPNQNKIETRIGEEIFFQVNFADGSTYQWKDIPQMIWIYDIQQMNNYYQVQGVEPFPLEPYEKIMKEKESKFIQLIGFEKTIKDDREFWRVQMNEEKPFVHIRQSQGGVFQYEFNLDLIPNNKNRLYLSEDTPQVTYADKAFFKGFKPRNLKLNPIKGRIKESKNDPIFIWEAATLNKHDINRAELEIFDGEQKYLGFYEVYRGVPTEISYRVSGIVDAKGLVFTSEISLNHWFEKIFDSQNITWSKLRWGLSVKHFQTLNPIKVPVGDNEIDPMNMSAFNVDLKYRLTPGIWDRDETQGLMLSYQNTTFGPTHAPIAGVGWFWARSMPRIFDELMNKLPFMGHDKWVDMEFIYFPYSLSKDVTLTANYNLNFHGKVLWTDSIFGEAGFGLKKYGFEDHPNNKLQDLYTVYGTVGLGINF